MSTTPTPKRFGRYVTRHGVSLMFPMIMDMDTEFAQRFSGGAYVPELIGAIRHPFSRMTFERLALELFGPDGPAYWTRLEKLESE